MKILRNIGLTIICPALYVTILQGLDQLSGEKTGFFKGLKNIWTNKEDKMEDPKPKPTPDSAPHPQPCPNDGVSGDDDITVVDGDAAELPALKGTPVDIPALKGE